MAKKAGVIPVSDVKALGQKRKCPMVVVFAIEEGGQRFTTATWGRTKELCQLAAGFGEDIATAILNGTLIPRQTPDGLSPEPTVKGYVR